MADPTPAAPAAPAEVDLSPGADGKFTQEQMQFALQAAEKKRTADLAALQSSKDREVSNAHKQIKGLDALKGLDAQQQAAALDLAHIAADHAEVLAEKFGLDERQQAHIAAAPTAAERRERAELFATKKTTEAPMSTQPSGFDLRAELAKLGVVVPPANASVATPRGPAAYNSASARGGSALPTLPDSPESLAQELYGDRKNNNPKVLAVFRQRVEKAARETGALEH